MKIFKKIKNKISMERQSYVKLFSIMSMILALFFFIGILAFAFPSGVERPTYCLTCKTENHGHRYDLNYPKGILDYEKQQGGKRNVIAGFQIYKNDVFLVKTDEQTKLEYAMVGDTLKFKDYSIDADLFTFQYATPSGIGNKVYKKITKSAFENISLKLTEAGVYTFFLAVQKGEYNNWNGEHVVLGCGQDFPNGVYSFFVRIDIVVKEPKLNVEYYIDNINSPISKKNVVFDETQLTYDSSKELYTADYYADSDLPKGYTYDNKWDLYLHNGAFLYSGTTNTNVRPGFNLTYYEKILKVKVAKGIPGQAVNINVEYRLDDVKGEELIPTKQVTGYLNKSFNLSSEKIDGYTCVGHHLYKKDGTSKYIENSSVSIDKLIDENKVIFIYKKQADVTIPKCVPRLDGLNGSTTLNIKRSVFEKLEKISVQNATFGIENVTVGLDKDKKPVEGEHNFETFDFYVYINGKDKRPFEAKWDNTGHSANLSFDVNKSMFTKVDDTTYRAIIDVDYVGFCSCRGAGFSMEHYHEIIVSIIDNKPPVALFRPCTEILQADGSIREIRDIYIGRQSSIKNMATDPNGIEDISYLYYTFFDSNNNGYFAKIKNNDGLYTLENSNVNVSDNLILSAVKNNGDLEVRFKTGETWKVSQTVVDIDGLSDTYTENITPIELSLEPIARLTDISSYRYPTMTVFSGKQNRIVGLSSDKSTVANFLQGTTTVIDHNKDCLEIIPLNKQSIDSIYFEKDLEKVIENNTIKINNVDCRSLKLMFKNIGKYKLRLQVTDTDGNVSKWTEEVIIVVEDISPLVTFNIDNDYYRNSVAKVANIQFYTQASSSDSDFAKINDVSYRFDSNNNGSFDDESFSKLNLILNEVDIDGIKYTQVNLKSANVGAYQFYVYAKDTFGQDTIYKYINSSDYKVGVLSKSTKINNYAPVGQLTLSNTTKKNIDIKILAGDLSGTRSTDLINNIDSLKQSLEANGKLNANIEIINTAKTVTLADNGLTWRKVVMGGKFSGNPRSFWYKDIKDIHTSPSDPIIGTRVEALPENIYATGWNGIPISELGLYKNYKGVLTHEMIDRTYELTELVWVAYAANNTCGIRSTSNQVTIGSFNGFTNWEVMAGSVSDFQAMSNEKLSDFDISFDIGYDLDYDWEGTSPNEYMRYFYFNVKDENNYYVHYIYYPREPNPYGYYLHTHYGLEEPWGDNLVEGVVQIKNGKIYIIKQFHTSNDLGKYYGTEERPRLRKHGYTVQRIRQIGKTLEIYTEEGKIATIPLDDDNLGGYIGVGGDGFVLKRVSLNINSLTFIENGNITEVIKNTSWSENSDKYVLNIQENTKLDELRNIESLNKSIGILQAKNINLINIGINSVNGTKLKEMITKNSNNGTYIELGNISDNLVTVSSYIKNKYITFGDEPLYILVGDTLKYNETYSDVENDSKFSSRFKFIHMFDYFENNSGVILNNNEWREEGIYTFDKVGKYIVQYQVQDNPLNDLLLTNPFSEYRKLSNIYQKEIYVHRKPISRFVIDNSFKAKALFKRSILENFEDNNLESYFNITLIRRSRRNIESEELIDILEVPEFVGKGLAQARSERDSDWDSYELDELNFDVVIDVDKMIQPVISFDYTVSTYVSENTSCSIRIRITDKDTGNIVLTKYLTDNSGTSHTKKGTIVYEIPKGLKNLDFSITASPGSDTFCYTHIDNLQLVYHERNLNVQVPITESSFDLDHNSLSNKGIIEWEWKVVKKDGSLLKQNFSDRNLGLSWVKSNLIGVAWEDSTVLLRVKDMEGAWSDYSSCFIDEDIISNPGEEIYTKPVALFDILVNPVILNVDRQKIRDNSYDLKGLPLTHHWSIYKDNVNITDYIGIDIDTKINEIISANGEGNYKIDLKVYNSKNLCSDTVSKSFDVIRLNSAPFVNFNLVSNENPLWVFPRTIGHVTIFNRPSNTLFLEEKSKFIVDITDVDVDNIGFNFNWKFERYNVKNISDISGFASNIFSYSNKYPFADSFKTMFLPWGAYRITLSVTDNPPIPPFKLGDAKTTIISKDYYIVPELNLNASFAGDSEVVAGDSIKLKARTNKEATNVNAEFNGDIIGLIKVSEDSSHFYWEKIYTIPETITTGGTYYINFTAYTNYGGNGNNTRKIVDIVPIEITALKLFNFRITEIVNHFDITYPYTKDMLVNNLINYKTGYYVTFQIDSKGKPDQVKSKIYIDSILDQSVTLEKISSGSTETWQGRFYTNARLSDNKIISIKTSCNKGNIIYDYNQKENWDGRSLIIKGSALQDGRINLTN